MVPTSTAAFPDVSGLEKSADGSEIIYGGSVAINRLLGLLRDTAGSPTATPWMLYLINAFTLADNVFDVKATTRENENAFHADVNLLCQYIEAYMASFPRVLRAPVIVFYIPDYGHLPKKLVRGHKEGTRAEALDTFYKNLRLTFPIKASRLNPGSDASQQWSVHVGGGTFPHRDLVQWLRETSTELSYVYNSDPAAIITHCPIDLHIHRMISNLSLLERYTGRIQGPSQFGHKLNKDGFVPFNLYTHRVFGDSVHLKPMVSGKDKKALLKVAEEKSWWQKGQQDILKDIVAETGIPATELIAIRL